MPVPKTNLHIARIIFDNPFIQSYIKYTTTIIGRDKAYRFIQYASRFLVYIFLKYDFSKDIVTKTKNVQLAMGQTRKILRLGRFIDSLNLAIKSAKVDGDTFVTTMATLNKVAMAGYLFFDALNLLRTFNIVSYSTAPELARRAHKGWLIALTCSWLSGMYQLIPLKLKESVIHRAQETFRREKSEPAEKEVERAIVSRQLTTVKRQLVQDSLDMLIPLSGLGFLDVNEGIVALAGTITSFMGGQSHFNKLMA
ncbi:Peroxisomal membrane protein PMP27 [Mycoemilia scoparia]|uniref:Peroxisomal membrane protein PMP27 n=1 Tax=Mycoemilia scoparia TaxID=417184 RepID=A0A9W8A682_9FUNG|nr:Peroxisomal membrane protein PMP27 [Mycoemilia scoparia]